MSNLKIFKSLVRHHIRGMAAIGQFIKKVSTQLKSTRLSEYQRLGILLTGYAVESRELRINLNVKWKSESLGKKCDQLIPKLFRKATAL
ncbi:MAG: hypothetical protein CMM03_05425 [Rhodopirellula sp.]|nr:hypothetical protein [Rhodopirellula sp.]